MRANRCPYTSKVIRTLLWHIVSQMYFASPLGDEQGRIVMPEVMQV